MRQRLETWLIGAEAVRGTSRLMTFQLGGCQFIGYAEATRGTALRVWRGCRSTAGHHPYQRNMVNVGSVDQAPLPRWMRGGQEQRHLRPDRRGGGPVVVSGRESRPQGEGDQ